MPEVTDPRILDRFGGGVVRRPVDPFKPAAERRAEEDQDLQRRADERAAAQLRLSQGNQGLQEQSQQFQQGNAQFDNLKGLRDSFNNLQAVKDYKAVIPLLMAGLQRAATPAGDNALIYDYAKIMDPGSVVREQEGEAAASTAGFWDQAVERYKKAFGYDDARGLPAGAANGLREEMNRKVSQLAKAYGIERLNAQEFAKANGYDPQQVVGRPPFEPFVDRYLQLRPSADQSKQQVEGLDPNAPFSTDEDKRVMNLINAARRGGATFDDLNELHLKLRGVPLDETQRRYLQQGGEGDFPAAKSGQPSLTQRIVTPLAQDPTGAGAMALTGVNASLGGLPTLISGQDNLQALRADSPWASMGGEMLGGAAGAVGAGKVLGAGAKLASASPTVAALLANPITAETAYGSTFGATTSDDPVAGALWGGALASLGGAAGAKVSQLGGQRAARQAALDAVPSSDQLRRDAADLYAQAGLNPPATGAQTQDLADSIAAQLTQNGRIGPTGRVYEAHPKVKEAYQLIQDYAGREMTPAQIQATRDVVAEGRQSLDNSEAYIARLLTDNFDNWAQDVVPELSRARETSSRYLTADTLEQARRLAEADAPRYSASGFENAIRQQYRNLDKAAIRGQENFDQGVLDAIETVSRGTPLSNTMRYIGKLAPTGPISGGVSFGVPFMAGHAIAGPALGAGLSALTMGTGAVARKAATSLADREATIAEILARNGGGVTVPQIDPELVDALTVAGLLSTAAPRLTAEEQRKP